MVRINRNELPHEDLTLLLRRFDHTLAKFDQKGMATFLGELLGREERLTLAKRLATIVLLCEGYSEYKVSRVLKLSPTTTGNIGKKINTGEYDGIIRLLKKKKLDYEELWNTLDSILHLGGYLPHRVGTQRYRDFRKIRQQ